jgi:ferredoxin
MSRRGRSLRIDPTACEGVGLCAHLAPASITLDSWGFPVITERELTSADRRAATRAVLGCPRDALFLSAD